jgi:hypothetical protein
MEERGPIVLFAPRANADSEATIYALMLLTGKMKFVDTGRVVCY